MHQPYQPLYINWQERNETGIPLIDEQHRGIVSIVNTFHHMISQHRDNIALYTGISDTLKNYAHIHFMTEEAFMKASHYPNLEQHTEIHRSLTKELERVESQAIKNNDAQFLLEFLKKWWMDHINEKDQLYAAHLKSHLGN